ncbi:hypothetical protein ABT294_40955 [Nonomuraea sp. NPDC000554]|uniref:hypothetical protein n=1 Tax=Nonomuraea sp. NPDC000554 TaxID=3154259 RepID=UPI0033289352
MAAIVRAMDDSTLIEYSEFTIIDDGGSDDPEAEPFAESWEERDIAAEWLAAADNLLMINSAFDRHRVRVRFELWDGEPEKESQLSNIDALTTSFYSSTGAIFIDEMIGYVEHDPFKLGPPGERWHVRAYRKALVPRGYFPEHTEEELEAYIFRFWPLNSETAEG